MFPISVTPPRWRFLLPACALAIGVASSAFGVVPSLKASNSSGVAPLAVFFDARGTTETGFSPTADFLDLSYEWDFGDTACRQARLVWTYSGKSRCSDLGPVAGHVYEKPGAYTATLTVRSPAGVATRKVTVQVADPNVVFSGAKTVCISRSGNFSDPANVCANAQKVTSGASFESLRSSYLSSGVRMLFRRGESWTNGGAYRYSGTAPTIVGAFGTGPKPKILQGSSNMFTFATGAAGLRIMDLDVSGNADPSAGSVIKGGNAVRGLLVIRVDIANVAKPVLMGMNQSTPLTPNMHRNVAVVESTTTSRPGNTGNVDFFGGGEQFLFMGNDFGNAKGLEHDLRFQYLKGAVVSHNHLGGGYSSKKHIMKMHNIFNGKPCTEEVVVADNQVIVGNSAIGFNFGPQNGGAKGAPECVRLVRVERNFMKFAGSKGFIQIALRGGENLVADNIFDLSGHNSVVRPQGILVAKRSGSQIQRTQFNRIYNNTCYSASSGSGASCVRLAGSAEDTEVRNNLIYAPNEGRVQALEDQGAARTQASANYVAGQNPFVSSTPTTAQDFQVKAGTSSVIDAGSPAQMKGQDFSARPLSRVVKQIDIGAWEHGAAGAAAGPPTPPVLLP